MADIGCGFGSSSVLIAQAYPNSTVAGSDYHAESIEAARKQAAEAGVNDRVSFEVATAQTFTGSGFDLVTMFDALHDMGDPVGAAGRVREAIADDGTWLLVEPNASDVVEENFHTDRAALLRRVDLPVRAERAVPAGRLRTRRSGR